MKIACYKNTDQGSENMTWVQSFFSGTKMAGALPFNYKRKECSKHILQVDPKDQRI